MSQIQSNLLEPATLKIGDITFTGIGALKQEDKPSGKNGIIIFTFDQLSIAAEIEVREKFPKSTSAIFTGIRYLLNQETEEITAEVVTHSTYIDQYKKTVIVDLEFTKRCDGKI
jgi:hypothetical protein